LPYPFDPFDPFNPYPKLSTPGIARPLPRTATAARAGFNKLEIRIERIQRMRKQIASVRGDGSVRVGSGIFLVGN
jgi:hypothetical protein